MDSILDYFISLQESEPAELPERAIERWNKRADFWEDARKKKEKGDERALMGSFNSDFDLSSSLQDGKINRVKKFNINSLNIAFIFLRI